MQKLFESKIKKKNENEKQNEKKKQKKTKIQFDFHFRFVFIFFYKDDIKQADSRPLVLVPLDDQIFEGVTIELKKDAVWYAHYKTTKV